MKTLPILGILTGLVLVLGFYSPNVSAYESVVTNCPSGYNERVGTNGWITYPWYGQILDGNYAELYLSDGLPKFLAISDFTDPWPGSNGPQPLPPDDAYIIWVEMVVSVYANHGSIIPITLEYALGESATNVSGETAIWTAGTNATQTIIGPNPLVQSHEHHLTFWSNVTSLESWTPTMLKNDSTWVRIYSNNPASPDRIYVDYVGFEYVWTMDPDWAINHGYGPPGSSDFSMGMMSVTGMLGTVGFIGMVAIPAVTIWMFRRDGGSKIKAGVMALVTFTICFGFFLGSINGG